MTRMLTREVLEAYLDCKLKGHLKLAGKRGIPSDYGVMHKEERSRVRQCATHKFLEEAKDCDVLCKVTVTETLLKRGISLILDATVESEKLAVCFDGLRKVGGHSKLGDFHYLPMLFHEGDRLKRSCRTQLAIFGLILGRFQGKDPTSGIVIHGRECVTRRVNLKKEIHLARQVMREIEEAQSTETPPKLLLNDHCQVCEFMAKCHNEAVMKDDISLLRCLSKKQISKYARRGIFSVNQLSYTFRPKRKYVATQRRILPHQHALQALAIREKKIYVLGTPDNLTCSTRLYFDIEGDPERGFEYLLGMIVVADQVVERYSFWGDGPADEPRLFQQFIEVIERYEDFRIYCYGGYEAVFLRRMFRELQRLDLAEKVLPRLTNVLYVVNGHIYFPTYSNSLKDICNYLGFQWTESNASGIQSIVWRRSWEASHSNRLKTILLTYNLEDCTALKVLVEFIDTYCRPETQVHNAEEPSVVVRVEDLPSDNGRPDWSQSELSLPDFSFVNERSFFDYQRDKVFVRTSKTLRKACKPKPAKLWKKNRPVNREIELHSQACTYCGGTEITQQRNRSLARLAFNLRVTRGGIRRWIIRYRTAWHHCARCGKRFLPSNYLHLQEFCHSLKSWAMFEHVAHRTSLPNIAETIRECFNMPIYHNQVHAFKTSLANYYRSTYERLFAKLLQGPLVHADETEVNVRRLGKGYVWVFTNLEEVVYQYRPSREGGFLREMLRDFRGVVISDFYAAYDSLDCPQQKCLVHLIRDFNQAIVGNPWDEELKMLATTFGRILRTIVGTIDKFGLRHRHLAKHRREVDRFFETAAKPLNSEVAEAFRKRLLRYQTKLFTFLDHDGIPWNNNNAEHAVKGFAYYREIADNLLSDVGLNQYLVLLSIYQTCRYKGLNFLKFLLSGQTDIDEFSSSRSKNVVSAIEVYPEGSTPGRQSRKRLSEMIGIESSAEVTSGPGLKAPN